MVSYLNRRSNCRAAEEPVLRGQEGSSRVLWNPSVTSNARCTTLLFVPSRRKGCPPRIGSLAVSWGFPVPGISTTISASWKRKGGFQDFSKESRHQTHQTCSQCSRQR